MALEVADSSSVTRPTLYSIICLLLIHIQELGEINVTVGPRKMFAENHIHRLQLILPIFVKEGAQIAIPSMPDVNVLSRSLYRYRKKSL